EPDWPKGWRPYLALFACFFLMFNSWGFVNGYGTFGSYYYQHLLRGTNILLINLIGSSQCFFILAPSVAMGRLLDAGYQRPLLVAGTILTSLGMTLTGVVNHGTDAGGGSYGLTYLMQGFLMPLGMACFFVASSQIAATWFAKKKSIVVGIVACGASIAGLVYPVMMKFLLAAIGFKKMTACIGALSFLLCAFAVVFAQPPAKWFEEKKTKPEKWLEVETFFDPSAFKNAAFRWCVASVTLMFFGFYAVFFNLEEWAAVEGYGKKDAVPGVIDEVTTPSHQEIDRGSDDAIRTFYLLSIMNACSTIGRIGSAIASERFGAPAIHALVTFVSALLVLCFQTTLSSVGGAVAFVVLFGAFSGAVIGLPPACVFFVLEHDEKADKRKLGQWTGMMYTIAAPFALTGPIIAGAIIQYTGGYLGAHLWSGTCLFLSAFCM
ncbi:MFS general substrate transporter, partial [Rhizodiscina lignyota]